MIGKAFFVKNILEKIKEFHHRAHRIFFESGSEIAASNHLKMRFLLLAYTIGVLIANLTAIRILGSQENFIASWCWFGLAALMSILSWVLKKPKKMIGSIVWLSLFASLVLSFGIYLDLRLTPDSHGFLFPITVVMMALFYTLPFEWDFAFSTIPSIVFIVFSALSKEPEEVGYDIFSTVFALLVSWTASLSFLDFESRNFIQEEKLRQAATTDTLTGLPNRRRLDQCWVEFEKNQQTQIGVIFLDINGLKQTNDLYGHRRGDQLIIEFSKMIAPLAGDCLFGRISGDEFIIVSAGKSEEEFRLIVNSVDEKLKESDPPIAAYGYAYSEAYACYDDMIKESENAMYRDKREIHKAHPEFRRD